MEDLGESLGKAQTSYDKALNNLRDGRGNLLGRAQRMTELGLKVKTQLKPQWAQSDAPAKDEPGLELKP